MSTVRCHDDGVVRYIIFNRPEKLNAWRLEELLGATTAVRDAPSSARAIVFRGAGERAFSVGADVNAFLTLNPTTAREFITALRDFLHAARTAPVPTICAIHGYCLGAAFELALSADLRVASSAASFGLPEIAVGVPSVLDAALLQQHVGLSFAKEMILTGARYPATAFHASGLLNRVAPEAEFDTTVEDLVATVSAHSTTALRAQKRLFEQWQNLPLEAAIARSIDEFAGVFAADETQKRLRVYRARLGHGAAPSPE